MLTIALVTETYDWPCGDDEPAQEPSDSDILAMKKKGYQYLKLYDEVFVSGKDLKDGMVIG